MDIGQLDGALNALDVLRVKRNQNGSFNSIITDGDDQGVITSQNNPASPVRIAQIWAGTQAQYDALAALNDFTLYVIMDA